MLYAIVLVFVLAVVTLSALSAHRSTTPENVSDTFHRAGRGVGSLEMSRQGYAVAHPMR